MYKKVFAFCLFYRILTLFVSYNITALLFLLLGTSYCVYATFYKILKKALDVKTLLQLIPLLIIVIFPQQWLDFGKFYVFESIYQNSAERIVTEVAEKQDTFTGQEGLRLYERILLNDLIADAHYIKQEDLTIVSFCKTTNFFQQYAFVYFSDSKAINLIMHPSLYQNNLSDADMFDYIIWLKKDEWAFIKWY